MLGFELLLRKIGHLRPFHPRQFPDRPDCKSITSADRDQSRRRVGGRDAGRGQGSPSKQTGQMASAASGSWDLCEDAQGLSAKCTQGIVERDEDAIDVQESR
jgi:hypothetical protein